MSIKKKSRNISSLTPVEKKKLERPSETLLKNVDSNEKFLVLGSPTNYSVSTNSSDLEGILDLGIKLSELSSSSSLSWSEDYESEVGKKIQSQLEKLDRLFQGLDEDPTPYDLAEMHEWKQLFPYLNILGSTTPTNSPQNSNATSEDEKEAIELIAHKCTQPISKKENIYQGTQSSFVNRRRRPPHLGHPDLMRNWNTLPCKPRSLELDHYLRISSIKSLNSGKRKQVQSISKYRITEDQSPEYISLPFLTSTPLLTQTKKKTERNKLRNTLVLPPIENSFRSISATPRQASSKSMFVSYNYDKAHSKDIQATKLKSDLMKLFDHIPITNR